MEEKLIKDLSAFDKEIYIQALINIAYADNVIKKEETDFINAQASLLNINTADYWNNKADIKTLNLKSISELTKKIIIRDSIVLANIDGNYDTVERKKIFSLAKLMNLSEDYIPLSENWLTEYSEIIKKGNKLLGLIN